MFVFLFKSNLFFLVGFLVLNVIWLCSLGCFIMSLSLNFDLVIRYVLCLREERSLNEGLKLFMKFNVMYIFEKRGIKMGNSKC